MHTIARKIGLSTKLASYVGTWWKTRTTNALLRHLDDHALKDIGLTRQDLNRWQRSTWL